jgi:hypothetical protein
MKNTTTKGFAEKDNSNPKKFENQEQQAHKALDAFADKVQRIAQLPQSRQEKLLKQAFKELRLPEDWLSSQIKFNAEKYAYQKLIDLLLLEMSLIGWLPLQLTNPHGHISHSKEDRSIALVRVIYGNAINLVYEEVGICPQSGAIQIKLCRTEHLKANEVAIVKPEEFHVFGNESPSEPLATLHLYCESLASLTEEEKPRYEIVV